MARPCCHQEGQDAEAEHGHEVRSLGKFMLEVGRNVREDSRKRLARRCMALQGWHSRLMGRLIFLLLLLGLAWGRLRDAKPTRWLMSHGCQGLTSTASRTSHLKTTTWLKGLQHPLSSRSPFVWEASGRRSCIPLATRHWFDMLEAKAMST
ncbi:unnamed protein product [Symbiodinium sp. CCMP2592]|nr:unnamed protein product [Symbiodinium sp. CCMP2592]